MWVVPAAVVGPGSSLKVPEPVLGCVWWVSTRNLEIVFFYFYDADKMSCLLKSHAVEEILLYYWVWTLISQAADEARGGTVPSPEGRQRSR